MSQVHLCSRQLTHRSAPPQLYLQASAFSLHFGRPIAVIAQILSRADGRRWLVEWHYWRFWGSVERIPTSLPMFLALDQASLEVGCLESGNEIGLMIGPFNGSVPERLQRQWRPPGSWLFSPDAFFLPEDAGSPLCRICEKAVVAIFWLDIERRSDHIANDSVRQLRARRRNLSSPVCI